MEERLLGACFQYWKLFGGVATGRWPALSLCLPRGQSFALQRTVPVAAALLSRPGVVVFGGRVRGFSGAGVVSF